VGLGMLSNRVRKSRVSSTGIEMAIKPP